jgi:hypothetical protein
LRLFDPASTPALQGSVISNSYVEIYLIQIQKVFSFVQIQSDETNPIWSVLPPASRELITPLLNSKYKVDKDGKEVSFSCPLYLSFDGKTFDKWLSNWFAVMSLSIQDASSPAYQLFQLSRHIVPRNNRVASFLLPFVASMAHSYAIS